MVPSSIFTKPLSLSQLIPKESKQNIKHIKNDKVLLCMFSLLLMLLYHKFCKNTLTFFRTVINCEENQFVNCTDGPAKIQKSGFTRFFNFAQPPGLNRDRPECRRHAWPIRRRTINNHSKTDMFNRVFAYGWFIVCQGREEKSEWGCHNE